MSKIKFAVVREDPLIEQAVIEHVKPQDVLMVASGGCTALSLKMLFPNINFTLFDFNPAQINLVKDKIEGLKNQYNSSFYNTFNIGEDSRHSLNGCGEFESLFRSFRRFINEFILPAESIRELFLVNSDEAEQISNKLTRSKYWPVAFDLYFSDSLLLAMFGSNAVQHAKPGSYPRYFQQVIEKGLGRADYKNNYFLISILLGYYIDDNNSWPYYLTARESPINFDLINSELLSIREIRKFQVISLSNLFDWMNEEDIHKHLNYLNQNLEPGSYIIWRQLNNDKDYTVNINGFITHKELAQDLLIRDRSLFYNKINIIEKI